MHRDRRIQDRDRSVHSASQIGKFYNCKEKKRERKKLYEVSQTFYIFNSTVKTVLLVQLQKEKRERKIILQACRSICSRTNHSSLYSTSQIQKFYNAVVKKKRKREKNYTIFHKLFNSTVLLGTKVDQLVPEDASSFIGKLRHGLETAAKEREREREVVDSIQ